MLHLILECLFTMIGYALIQIAEQESRVGTV